ncbi:MAG: C13 family peptidase [Candidatus Hodarchaeales archaeon]|jgi:hypothetical protein
MSLLLCHRNDTRYYFVAFDTGINTEIESVSLTSFQLWFTSSNMEGNDGVGVKVYYVNGSTYGNGTGQAREDSTSWTQGTSISQDKVWTDPSTGQYTTGTTSQMDTILEYWADNRGDSENWVNFRLHGNYNGIGDNINGQDSIYGETRAPKLSFSYVTEDYDYWALIVAGSMDAPDQSNARFMHDALNMFNTLNDTYDGFTNDSIFLLTPNATDDVSGDPIPRDRTTSKANVEWAIDQIATLVESSQLSSRVLIFWVSHGNVDLLECENNNNNETISASDLDSALDEITCDEMFIIIDACMSGSLIDDLDDEQNRAIYTSANSTHVSWGFEGGIYGNWFARGTYYALDPDLNATYADDNSDNRTSLYEMWDYAYDYVMALNTIYSKVQDPQRWVGSSIGNDSLHYIYDGYYQ